MINFYNTNGPYPVVITRDNSFPDTITNVSTTPPDGQINLSRDGNIYIKNLKNYATGNNNSDIKNTIIYSNFVVTDGVSMKDHLFNETAVIYNNCLKWNDKNYYPNPIISPIQYFSGNALTLTTTDISSVAFMNISNANKNGIKIGGGAYTNDNTKDMGVIGLTNVDVPNQVIVSSGNKKFHKSILGINNLYPKIDVSKNYVMDINGPVIIEDTDVRISFGSSIWRDNPPTNFIVDKIISQKNQTISINDTIVSIGRYINNTNINKN